MISNLPTVPIVSDPALRRYLLDLDKSLRADETSYTVTSARKDPWTDEFDKGYEDLAVRGYKLVNAITGVESQRIGPVDYTLFPAAFAADEYRSSLSANGDLLIQLGSSTDYWLVKPVVNYSSLLQLRIRYAYAVPSYQGFMISDGLTISDNYFQLKRDPSTNFFVRTDNGITNDITVPLLLGEPVDILYSMDITVRNNGITALRSTIQTGDSTTLIISTTFPLPSVDTSSMFSGVVLRAPGGVQGWFSINFLRRSQQGLALETL